MAMEAKEEKFEKFVKRQKVWFLAGWLVMFFATASFFREDFAKMSDGALDALIILLVATAFLWLPYEYYLRKKS